MMLPTWFCTDVEREFLRLLGGGCNLPLGIRTSLDGRRAALRGNHFR